MSMRASYTVENVLNYIIPVSNHLWNEAFKMVWIFKFILPTTEAYLKFMKHWF